MWLESHLVPILRWFRHLLHVQRSAFFFV